MKYLLKYYNKLNTELKKNINYTLLNKLNILDNLVENYNYSNTYTYNDVKYIYNIFFENFINIFDDKDFKKIFINNFQVSNKNILINKINELSKIINRQINYKKFVSIIKFYYFDHIHNKFCRPSK
jgi:hypothetical protein